MRQISSLPPSKPGHPQFVGITNLPTGELWGLGGLSTRRAGQLFACCSSQQATGTVDAIAHRRLVNYPSLSRQVLWSCRVNIKHVWIAGILIPVAVVAGWSYSREDIDSLRASYAISPDAVIMFSRSDCGRVCTDHASKISAAGIEVVPLDINDGTAGSHLWQALEGGNGPFPAFLVAGADRIQARIPH